MTAVETKHTHALCYNFRGDVYLIGHNFHADFVQRKVVCLGHLLSENRMAYKGDKMHV